MSTDPDAAMPSPAVAPPRIDTTAPLNWRKLLFSPKGRIGRKSFWLGIVLFVVAVGVVDTLDEAFLRAAHGEDGPLSKILMVAFVYPAICFQTKRFHDLGRTGWLQAAPFAVMSLTMPAAAAGLGDYIFLIVVAAGLLMVTLFVWTAFRVGQPGANKYGEPNSGDRDIAPFAEVFS